MLYMEIITVCFEIRWKKCRNLCCEQKVQFLDVKSDGTYSNHYTLLSYLQFPVWFNVDKTHITAF